MIVRHSVCESKFCEFRKGTAALFGQGRRPFLQVKTGSAERFFGTIANRPEAVRKLVDKLAGRHARLAFCYEDGVIPARRFRFP
jgi:hypothetical protein